MNERIKELVEQAFIITTDGKIGHVNNYMVEKFAELIVQKCADIGEQYADGNYEVRNQILKHFGLEEPEE